MSIVAWDGHILAADRQVTCGDMKVRGSKMRRLPSGSVLAWTGNQDCGLILSCWYENGADIDKWPEFQKLDNWTRLIVADRTGIFYYEQHPVSQRVLEPFLAFGSGRDYAMGALEMGANAVQAVEVASRFDIYSGLGVESYEVIE